jgi:prophage regulatory protein
MTDRMVLDAECGKRSGLSRVTRWRREREGRFPKRVKISTNRIAWRDSELTRWQQSPETYRQQEAPDASVA